jgi:hypothetical protein
MKKFKVFHRGFLGDEGWEVEARDHEDAAKRYAKYYDSDGEGTLARGRAIEVDVYGIDADWCASFRLFADIAVVYKAKSI